jgi:hypothetical protein
MSKYNPIYELILKVSNNIIQYNIFFPAQEVIFDVMKCLSQNLAPLKPKIYQVTCKDILEHGQSGHSR